MVLLSVLSGALYFVLLDWLDREVVSLCHCGVMINCHSIRISPAVLKPPF